MKPINRAKSLTELAVGEIRQSIVNGSIEMGESLPEVALAERLNISRTPVREALAELRREGLVVQDGKYHRVFTLSGTELLNLYEYRFGMESMAVSLAMKRNPLDYSKALIKCVEKMNQQMAPDQVNNYLASDEYFHELAFDYAGNRYLSDAYKQVKGQLAVLRSRITTQNDITERTLKDHIAFSNLIEQRKTGQALELLDHHINSVADFYQNIRIAGAS